MELCRPGKGSGSQRGIREIAGRTGIDDQVAASVGCTHCGLGDGGHGGKELRRRKGSRAKFDRVDLAVEIGIRGILAAPEIIPRGRNIGRQKINAVVDGQGYAVGVKNGLATIKHHGQVSPDAHRERGRSLQHLDVSVAVRSESDLHLAVVIQGSQHHPAAGIGPKIEEPLPGGAAIPLHPCPVALKGTDANGKGSVLAAPAQIQNFIASRHPSGWRLRSTSVPLNRLLASPAPVVKG